VSLPTDHSTPWKTVHASSGIRIQDPCSNYQDPRFRAIFILILSFHLRLGIQNDLFCSVYATKCMWAMHFPSTNLMRVTCLFDLITVIISDEF